MSLWNPRLKPRAGARLNPNHWAGKPAACWLFNEGGGNARDISPNANAATLNGGLSWSPSALRFGTNGSQYASAADSPSLRFGTSDFTILATFTSTGGGQQSIVDKRVTSGAQTGYTIYATSSAITIQLNDAAAAHGYQINYAGLFNGAWNTLAVVISRTTNTANFYVNGKLIGLKNIAATGGSLANAVPLTIGASGIFTGGMTSALLAALTIYPAALSSAQVWQLYQRPYGMILRRLPPKGFFPGIDRHANCASALLSPRFSAASTVAARHLAAAAVAARYGSSSDVEGC